MRFLQSFMWKLRWLRAKLGLFPRRKVILLSNYLIVILPARFQLLTFSLFKFFGEMLVFYIGGRLFLLNFLNIWHKSIMNPDKQRT